MHDAHGKHLIRAVSSDTLHGMNKLSADTRALILSLLVEGMSIRSISRHSKVSTTTVTKLLVDAGEACAAHHDEQVVNVQAKHVECDEVWSFCYAKEKNVPEAKAAPPGAGDVWTWTALERDTRLFIAYAVGDRSAAVAERFAIELRNRLANRVQLTTDGHEVYRRALDKAFGDDVDYGQIVKIYGKRTRKAVGIEKRTVKGEPVEAEMSTSRVERQYLNMRKWMSRFTRSTIAFSKKLENHLAMVSLYVTHYNFVRIHGPLKKTPAMAAGLSDHGRDLKWIVGLIDARAPKPKRPKHYRTGSSN